jgi:uncharacterized protein (TIGR04222 family)
MDTVFNNPLAQMYGPYFLLVYGAVIGGVLLVCHRVLRDRTAALPVPKIPDDLEPYEVAYLRGGENAIAQLVVARLVELGYWEIVETTRLVATENPPDVELLNEIEKQAFENLTPRQLATEVRGEIARSLSTEPLQQSLEQQNLLTSGAMRQYNCWVVKGGAIAILGLGGYKFIAAIHTHHYNVGFLVMMAAFSLIWLWFLYGVRTPRQTDLGKHYLQQLKNAFRDINLTKTHPDIEQFSLVVALFGDTPQFIRTPKVYAPILTTPKTTYRSSSSSSGSSSGSSCGSSCGGGCGGCGG